MEKTTQEILRILKETERLSEEIGELQLPITHVLGKPGNHLRSGQSALDTAVMHLRSAGQALNARRTVTLPSDSRDGFVRQRT